MDLKSGVKMGYPSHMKEGLKLDHGHSMADALKMTTAGLMTSSGAKGHKINLKVGHHPAGKAIKRK